MRALHVSPYFAPAFRYGGPVRSVHGLCRALGSSNVDVEVLTTNADGADEIPVDVVRRGEFDGVRVDYLERSFPRRYFNANGLVDAIRTKLSNVDIVHVHGLWSFPVWLAARECLDQRVPFVVSPRGMLDPGSLSHRALRKKIAFWLRERRYLREAALLHATSVAEEESLKRLELGPRIVRLPNGVCVPERARSGVTRERWGVDADAELVVYLGRLHPIKRLDLVVAAFDRVRRERPNARLVIAGPEDGLDGRELVRGAEQPEAVRWVGEVDGDEKWSLLAEADVVVSCSDSESFGMSVVEAMSMATPVVTTKTCPWEEVEVVGAGYWVEQRADAIARAIEAIVADPDEARAMGERARELVDGRYRWPAIARAMSKQYESVVA